MPTMTVRRLISDGPFRVGDKYDVAADDRDEHVHGVVCNVALIDDDEKFVEVTIDIADDGSNG